MRRRIILAGGSGFLGQLIGDFLNPRGWEPMVLTRKPMPEARIPQIGWDARTLGDWTRAIDGADAVVNLAGRSVNCRFTPENRRLVMESRVDSTRVLGEAIARCAKPPRVWLNSSTATIYKHSLKQANDESSADFSPTPEAKDAYSVEVALAWEKAFNDACTPRTRKVALRTTLVFGAVKGGVFQILRRLARLGLGGRMGSGRQYVSWIRDEDFCRALEWIVDRPQLTGPVNMAAPHPVTNAEMMALFRSLNGIPIGLPAAGWMLEVGAFLLRTETELLLKSRCVVPGKLLASGFQFRFPRMEEALRDLERRMAR